MKTLRPEDLPVDKTLAASIEQLQIPGEAETELPPFPTKKPSLVDDICAYLREAIYSFQLRPGDQINELELMKKTGTSRSPLREAMRLLEGEGLIERHSGRGTFVKSISIKELRETFSIRAVLEALAAEQALEHFGDADLAELTGAYEQLEKATLQNDARLYLKANFLFHRTFIKRADNASLEKLLKNLGGASRWLLFASLSVVNDNMKASLGEHRHILEGFRRKESPLLAKAVKEHILEGKRRIEIFLNTGG